MDPDNALTFPSGEVVRVASTRTSAAKYWLWRIYSGIGESLHELGFPDRLRSVRVEDEITGQQVVMKASRVFAHVRVNGRSYYYHHLLWCKAGRSRSKAHPPAYMARTLTSERTVS